ncbi:hypothetical protein Tco_1411928 [Tanacetum coccineum]
MKTMMRMLLRTGLYRIWGFVRISAFAPSVPERSCSSFGHPCRRRAHIKRSNSQEHGDTQEHVIHPDTNSFHFAHDEDNGEDAATHRFVPDLGLREDLRICSFRA